MRIDIPVITRCGPPLHITSNGAYVKNSKGTITWSYQGTEVSGKGIYIAACARSATVYITRVLQKLGYEVAHERTGVDGSVGYHLAVIKPKNCFHQVRHPLKQIASMLDHQSWGFINQVIECHGRGLLGCMQYWYKWNELLEEFCVWRFQIEQLDMYWNELLSRIGHKWCPIPEIPDIRKNTREESLALSHKEKTILTWQNLIDCNEELAEKIYNKHLEYGYSPARDREATEESQGSRKSA